MIFEIGIYRLNVDTEQTNSFYKAKHGISCTCDGCRNFVKAVYQLPNDVASFLKQFGIDAGKPAEMSAVYASDDNSIFYDGFYHICGTILDGTEPWVKVTDKQFRLDEQYAIHLSDGFSCFFTSDCHLLAEDFPKPAIQLEFSGTLPWALDKSNPYI